MAIALVSAMIPVSAGTRTHVSGTRPSWATSDRDRGQADEAALVELHVYLAWRNAATAMRLADDISNPHSANYGHFVSADEFRARFAPTSAQARSVVNWLTSAGLQVVDIPDNYHYIAVTGTAAQAEAAFDTKLHQYMVDRDTRRAPVGDITVPAEVAGMVTGVAGLNDDVQARPMLAESAPAAFVNAPPCSQFWSQTTATTVAPAYGVAQPYAPCGYTPRQLRNAYGVDGPIANGFNGAGVTVAVTDAYASGTLARDVATYTAHRGEPGFAKDQLRQAAPSHYTRQAACVAPSWAVEETLDVEAVHAMAPAASVLYVSAASCADQDLDSAINRIVDHHLAQIVTNSWGSAGEGTPPTTLAAYESTFIQAAVEGIGIFFSSGDAGDEVAATGIRQVDYPASDPWVTSVGGTSLGVGSQANYLFETAWGTTTDVFAHGGWASPLPGTFIYGGGGGTSRLFAQPQYQRGAVPGPLADYLGSPHRTVPDLAMDGDPNTGMLVGLTEAFPAGPTRYGEFRLGGTSLAAPLMAGVQAIADQTLGRAHGFANPAIYALAGTAAFRDIVNPPHSLAVVRNDFVNQVDTGAGTRTTLRSLDQTGTLTTTVGYDDATGLGTPVGSQYVSKLGR